MLGDFGKIYGYLRGSDANCYSVKDSTSYQHSSSCYSNLQGSASKPPEASEQESIAATKFIRDWACHDRADDRACSKGSTNGALNDSRWVVEVVTVGC